ncbi:hypothetical protein STIAU_3137, partial [Stigmatella aurantiaca DW4/3-1]
MIPESSAPFAQGSAEGRTGVAGALLSAGARRPPRRLGREAPLRAPRQPGGLFLRALRRNHNGL